MSEQASPEEIREAYHRSLMAQYHPDKVASLGPEIRELALRKSQQITEAYRAAPAVAAVKAAARAAGQRGLRQAADHRRTMLVSMAVYAISFGWPYAVGFVLLILVHELGHYIAARQRGLNVGAPVFIPFVGAWISLKETRLEPEAERASPWPGPCSAASPRFVCYLLALDGQGGCTWRAGAGRFHAEPVQPAAARAAGRWPGRRRDLATPVAARRAAARRPLPVAAEPLLLLIAVVAAPSVWAALKGTTPEHARLARAADRFRYAAQYLLLAAARRDGPRGPRVAAARGALKRHRK